MMSIGSQSSFNISSISLELESNSKPKSSWGWGNLNFSKSGISQMRKNPIKTSAAAAAAVEAANYGSLYELLGISERGTVSEIKNAYRKLARKYHPDVSPAEKTEEYKKRFIEVKEAYETLSDPQSRASYDRRLRIYKSEWESQLQQLITTRNSERKSWGGRMRTNCSCSENFIITQLYK